MAIGVISVLLIVSISIMAINLVEKYRPAVTKAARRLRYKNEMSLELIKNLIDDTPGPMEIFLSNIAPCIAGETRYHVVTIKGTAWKIPKGLWWLESNTSTRRTQCLVETFENSQDTFQGVTLYFKDDDFDAQEFTTVMLNKVD